MNRPIFRLVFLLSIALNIAFILQHTRCCPCNPECRKKEFRLSPHHQQHIRKIQDQKKGIYDELRRQLNEEQNRLVALLKEKEIDRKKLDHCLTRIHDLQKEIQVLSVEQIIKCKKVLSSKECCGLVDSCARRRGESGR